MTLQILILGMIQGVTEFLPVSSSGHLVLIQTLFGLKEMLFYDVLLHFATLLAVILFFYKDIIGYFKSLKIIFYIVLLTLPTGIIGVVIKKYLSFVYDNVLISGICLIITGLWLWIAETIYTKNVGQKIKIYNIGILKALLIGVVQGMSVLPGISRSGSTLGSALIMNIDKFQAVKFIFISSIPAILGATFLELKEVMGGTVIFQPVYIYGMITAFIFAILSLKFFIKIVSKQKLKCFSYYCWTVGLISILSYIFVNMSKR
jgi:undecaprenyl-diphosphatase